MSDVYLENGYGSREDYLKNLAEDFDVSLNTVYMLASMPGPDEDFDGLVSELEDAAEMDL